MIQLHIREIIGLLMFIGTLIGLYMRFRAEINLLKKNDSDKEQRLCKLEKKEEEAVRTTQEIKIQLSEIITKLELILNNKINQA